MRSAVRPIFVPPAGSSTNKRSSKLVVRVIQRRVTGNRRCAMQASKSSSKQETADGSVAA